MAFNAAKHRLRFTRSKRDVAKPLEVVFLIIVGLCKLNKKIEHFYWCFLILWVVLQRTPSEQMEGKMCLKHRQAEQTTLSCTGLVGCKQQVTHPEGTPDVHGSILCEGSRVTVPCRHLDHLVLQCHFAWKHLGPLLCGVPTKGPLVITAKSVNLK